MNFDSDMLGIGHAPFRVVLMAPVDLCVCGTDLSIGWTKNYM